MYLSPDTPLPKGITAPHYMPEAHGTGIVHFGPGAFHRAHQAVYTDDVLSRHGGDWRICGVSLQSTSGADALNRQGGRYCLTVPGNSGPDRRIIGSISGALAASRGIGPVLDLLAAESTRIVSMTVTEKAYGIRRDTGAVDISHPAIAADLANPLEPAGVVGIIVAGLGKRRLAGLPPFTVLCCDNLPDNGSLLRTGVLDFAQRTDPDLAVWIAENVGFPSTMVDRITPAATPELGADVASALGVRDEAAVETEPFTQWVIEDKFCNGRPRWEDAGVLFVPDVAPYEKMKLRMLNGAHSLIAYTGVLIGRAFVRDVMADPVLRRLAVSHMDAAARTLPRLAAMETGEYARALTARFANPAIAHETRQIAMDGSQKMTQRIFQPASEALDAGETPGTYAVATAAWMRFCAGQINGARYALRDPLETDIRSIFDRAQGSAGRIFDGFSILPGVVPRSLSERPAWRRAVTEHLSDFLNCKTSAAFYDALAHKA
ncbi:mannitol dehydrogenase family protein [uncultured Roseobacter sp.]|uniref:mannitol dehydrogenase family protein n=1 Tax=uncultured Roseobacter sp. TaxID=114847 RepID=UPI00263779E4|nr:mannitol dehydrogenase family protein [uncultured Roseobacter sp.]